MPDPSDAIRDWAAFRLAMPVVWAHPNAPRPTQRPYATVKSVTDQRITREYISPIDANGTTTVTGQRVETFSVSVYYGTEESDPRAAYRALQGLRDSLELPSVRDGLRAAGWVLQEVALLTDTPVMRDTRWEQRATLDVLFRRAVQQTDDLGYVRHIEGESTLAGQTEPFAVSTGEP